MEDLKTPVSQTIRYADGTETTVYYNALGEKMDQLENELEVSNQPAETSSNEVAEELGNTEASTVEQTV